MNQMSYISTWSIFWKNNPKSWIEWKI